MFFVGQVECMYHCDSRLLHGGGSQCRKANHITHRINIWDICLVVCIHKDQSSLTKRYTNLFQSQALHIALSTGCYQCNIKVFWSAFFQYQMDMITLRLDPRHAIVENK